MFPALILASTSRYRRELLNRFGIPFDAESPGIEERDIAHEPPAERASRLAMEKAQAVAARFPRAIIIGSDQVASSEGTVLHKPGTAERACTQLAQLSGRSADFHTACAVIRPDGRSAQTHTDITRIRFRALTSGEIARYVEREQPLDCAGSFKSEALGITLFETIETSDPTALVGLPLLWLAGALRGAGLALP